MRLSIMVAVLAILASIFLGRPSAAFADLSGTQSQSIIQFDNSVYLNIKGMEPLSLLTVSVATSSSLGYNPVNVGFEATDSNGSATVQFLPLFAVQRGYTGPLDIQVCDSKGNCLYFFVTVTAGSAAVFPRAQSPECALFRELLGSKEWPGFPTSYFLHQLGPQTLVQMAFQCGLTQDEARWLTFLIFPELAKELDIRF